MRWEIPQPIVTHYKHDYICTQLLPTLAIKLKEIYPLISKDNSSFGTLDPPSYISELSLCTGSVPSAIKHTEAIKILPLESIHCIMLVGATNITHQDYYDNFLNVSLLLVLHSDKPFSSLK